jgi:hypothetical protein
MKLCLRHEPSMEVTKPCNSVSYLNCRGISCNNKKHFPVIKFHQSIFCRPKNIQNIILDQNLGMRSIHNLSATDSFGNGDDVLKIGKQGQKETSSQEEYTLKLEKNTAKSSHNPRKRKGSYEAVKGEDNKFADGFLSGEESEEVAYKGKCYVMFLHLHILGM